MNRLLMQKAPIRSRNSVPLLLLVKFVGPRISCVLNGKAHRHFHRTRWYRMENIERINGEISTCNQFRNVKPCTLKYVRLFV